MVVVYSKSNICTKAQTWISLSVSPDDLYLLPKCAVGKGRRVKSSISALSGLLPVLAVEPTLIPIILNPSISWGGYFFLSLSILSLSAKSSHTRRPTFTSRMQGFRNLDATSSNLINWSDLFCQGIHVRDILHAEYWKLMMREEPGDEAAPTL